MCVLQIQLPHPSLLMYSSGWIKSRLTWFEKRLPPTLMVLKKGLNDRIKFTSTTMDLKTTLSVKHLTGPLIKPVN